MDQAEEARGSCRKSKKKCRLNSSSSSENSNGGSGSSSSNDSDSTSKSGSEESGNEESGSNSSAESNLTCPVPTENETEVPLETAQTEANGNDDIEEVCNKIDEYFRNKLMNKLIVEFKAELPATETGLRDNNPNLMRIPSFMHIDIEPHDADTYTSSVDPDELSKDSEKHSTFLMQLKTTVRWRITRDVSTGELFKESNARIVRWSDGSQTFHVGAEAFDVVQHPVAGNQHQLYIRLGNYYLPQCAIKEKLTLRPKLESNFAMSHMQGLRRRACSRPLSGCVKVLKDLTTNPVLDRQRQVQEERNQLRKEKCQLLREQKNQHKPSVTPMRHCTADDSDEEMRTSYTFQQTAQELPSVSGYAGHEARRSAGGIRTNRNTKIQFAKYNTGSDAQDDSVNDKGE